MKVTRDIIDNGRRIIHIEYDKKDIENVKKRVLEQEAKNKGEAETPETPDKQ